MKIGKKWSVEWIYGWDRYERSTRHWWYPLKELSWLLRKGEWCWGWNGKHLLFGAGRLYYDGPHWFAHVGPVCVSLSFP